MFINLFQVKNCNQYEQARKRISFFVKPIIRGDLQLFIYFYAAQFRHKCPFRHMRTFVHDTNACYNKRIDMWIYRSFCDHRLFLLNPIAPFANPQAQSYAAPRTSTTKRLAV